MVVFCHVLKIFSLYFNGSKEICVGRLHFKNIGLDCCFLKNFENGLEIQNILESRLCSKAGPSNPHRSDR